MIKQRVMFEAVCDGCGKEMGEGADIVAWSDAESAVLVAEESDWKTQDDGRLLCWDCRLLPGSDEYDPEEADDRLKTPSSSVSGER